MSEFKLSASLEGHEDDVRGVAFPSPSTIVSVSRDATVRLWKSNGETPPKYDGTIASHGQAFINSVTTLPPTKEYPDGLIISGGKDTIIEVREPSKGPDAHAERLLPGHAHNVCTLDVSPSGQWFASGSWDCSARVWGTGKWECLAELSGHEASVWSVLAYDEKTIITACADKQIRIFTPDGKRQRAISGGSDVVRALCKIPASHESGADFASAGNDGVIQLWKLNGQHVGSLYGHENFIYSLASLPTGELISSSEDRTVRIWRGSECVQTITHPAISVWSIAVCAETGDIVSGASDRIVRVFTRSTERQADAQTISAFEEAVRGSAIPQEQVGEINKEKLPGPEFLTQKSGTKDGQVQMIREANGSVTAHSWSAALNRWDNVGTVVSAVGSSGKKTDYLGKDYDYVFDVDIEDGKPPLKLPYNLSQNPYEAATKFIQDNELPMTYLDQVANFITSNTQGATLGQSSSQSQTQSAAGSDPWGSEQRYRPGGQGPPSSQPQPQPTRQKVLPQKQYLSIKTAQIKTIQKKLEELNEQLVSSGSKGESLDPSRISSLRALTSKLESSPTSISTSDDLDTVLHIVTTWPPASRLPGLDLLRLLTAATSAVATPGLLKALSGSGVFVDASRPNNQMLAIRALANLFETKKGQELADSHFEEFHKLVHASADGPSNRNMTIALATLHINLAVLITSGSHKDLPSSTDRALSLLDDLTKILNREKDSEAVYRALVALGTLLVLGEDVQAAAKDIYDLEGVLAKVESGVKEPRIRGLVGEIRDLLK